MTRKLNLNLESERLSLRPLAAGDLDLSRALLSDPEVMKYVGPTLSEAQLVERMPKITRRCAGGAIGIWSVSDRATGEKIGTGVLLPMPVEQDEIDWELVVGDDLPEAEIEVGYLLRRSAWGRGYATEICARLLRFAFEETTLEEVVAITDPDNVASQRVLRKCGLVDEGLRRAYASQCPCFRMTRRQWREANSARA